MAHAMCRGQTGKTPAQFGPDHIRQWRVKQHMRQVRQLGITTHALHRANGDGANNARDQRGNTDPACSGCDCNLYPLWAIGGIIACPMRAAYLAAAIAPAGSLCLIGGGGEKP